MRGYTRAAPAGFGQRTGDGVLGAGRRSKRPRLTASGLTRKNATAAALLVGRVAEQRRADRARRERQRRRDGAVRLRQRATRRFAP
jgi:hypothetical protein